MCELLQGLMGEGLGMALLRPWRAVVTCGGNPHFLACALPAGPCHLLCWQSWSFWPDNPGLLHSGQGAVLKVGRCGPFPQASAWSQDPESISSDRKKVSTRNDCKQEWDFIVWLRLKCYFVCILYSHKKLVCNKKATLCLLWGGRESRQGGRG